uniref:Putative reverse transcriptase-like protein n=1 Tax=Culex tarsalis TaxID=7177 RepID=A0A1Q3FZ15_CULTA
MAAAPFSRLDPFDCRNGDFEYYLEQFDQFLEINSVADDESKKVPLFIASIGQDAYKILKESCGPADPKGKSFEELRTLLLEYFARREFYQRNQRQGEYTGAFINEVKRLSLKCNFGPFQKEALRDRIACGRLEPDDKDDKKAVLAPLQSTNPKQQQRPQPNLPKKPKNPQSAPPQVVEDFQALAIPDSAADKGTKKKQPNQNQNQQKQRKCKICGHLHVESECPHKDASCFMCRKKGHIASVCREKIIKGQQQQPQQGQQPVEVHVHVQQNSALKNETPPAESVTSVLDNMLNVMDKVFKNKK